MSVPLPDLAKRLLDTNTFVTLSTINPDGAPQSTVIWAKRDGDDVLFSTIRGRRKTKNMERDPRVAICMFDPKDPYEYVEIRGPVELTEENGRELIQELSQRYDGVDFRVEPPEVIRVVCRVRPDKAATHN
ncbi:MAG TPA: PPOX class F420-dependent oxidoreductase [Micromonosporaceae bacterium]|jgi:PPOX class probable F420-dependent enzyme|nr:PPOX class F420-dependent oxidoreductase [Micromonosporaceae bacterium]